MYNVGVISVVWVQECTIISVGMYWEYV